jgi:DNA-binding NtrC family response regulator
MEDHANLSRAALPSGPGFAGLIGQSSPMRRLYELITKVSQSTSSVLITGESGTGKELVARAIHFKGSRCEQPLVPVDCSALSPTLVESELFGHVKGAFTGANYSKRGLLQAADRGTIFLDEIGELPMCLQAKLLRVLQEKEIRPLGSTERIPINSRIIAATNRDLEAGVRAGTFRQDLYFRLNVVQIRVPTLRERKGDIPLLVAHFLENFFDVLPPVRAISDGAMRRLMAYDWPGNVRELENAIECAVALSDSPVLTADDLITTPDGARAGSLPHSSEFVPLTEIVRRAVLEALREAGGNKIAAAHLLRIGKTTLYRKLKEYATAPQPTERRPRDKQRR